MLIPRLTIYGVKLPPVMINDSQVQAFYEGLTNPKFPTWLNHWGYICWVLSIECDFSFKHKTGFSEALVNEHGTNNVDGIESVILPGQAKALRREWVNHCIKYIEGEIPFANF